MNGDNEFVILVDEHDDKIGTEEKIKAHQEGKLHRAFSIFIFRRIGKASEILMQMRNPRKYHSGGLWTNTCCGHPRLGEDVVAAGQRRLREEIGIQSRLKNLGCFRYRAVCDNGLVENEIDHVLIGKYRDDPIDFDTSEVESVLWFPIVAAQDHLRRKPADFTPWFSAALDVVLANAAEVARLFEGQ